MTTTTKPTLSSIESALTSSGIRYLSDLAAVNGDTVCYRIAERAVYGSRRARIELARMIRDGDLPAPKR